MAAALCALGLWEWHIGKLPWAGHLPSFLKVDDPIIERILEGASRNGKGRRIQGPFSTSLGLSEFLALSFPFFLHYAVVARRLAVRIASAAMAPILLTVVLLTQARLGLVGMLVGALLFPALQILLFWYRNPRHPLGAAALMLAPFGAAVAAAVAFLTPGIRIRLLGGGVEQLSTQARYDQMHMGMPKILSHPWGYGIGRGADTLGYRNQEGFLTIDSYSLRIALEYGVVGFALYYAMFLCGIFYSAKTLSKAGPLTDELRLLIPITVAFASYLVMRTVFAQEDNQALVYCMFGMVVGIVAGAKSQARSRATSSADNVTS
jgi:O-antigen ligase